MVSIYSVDSNAHISLVAQELKKTDLVQPPEWAQFVKTGVAKQRPPVDDDWWFARAASVLRSVSKLGPIGVNKLRTKYGSKKNRGLRPEKFKDASGNILRTVLQQLEKEGLVSQNKDPKVKGRIITAKGQSLLEKCAASLLPEKSSKDETSVKEKKKEKKDVKPTKKSVSQEKSDDTKQDVKEKDVKEKVEETKSETKATVEETPDVVEESAEVKE